MMWKVEFQLTMQLRRSYKCETEAGPGEVYLTWTNPTNESFYVY